MNLFKNLIASNPPDADIILIAGMRIALLVGTKPPLFAREEGIGASSTHNKISLVEPEMSRDWKRFTRNKARKGNSIK